MHVTVPYHDRHPPISQTLCPWTSSCCGGGGGGYIKDSVYSKKVKDLVRLKHKIREAVSPVAVDKTLNAWNEFVSRFEIVKSTQSVLVEVYIDKSK